MTIRPRAGAAWDPPVTQQNSAGFSRNGFTRMSQKTAEGPGRHPTGSPWPTASCLVSAPWP
jgi:hypothetical protein